MTRVEAAAVAGGKGGFCGPAAHHPLQTRPDSRNRTSETTLGFEPDPDNAALASLPIPSNYAMQDTPLDGRSQDKSYLFCYQEKFALGRIGSPIRRHPESGRTKDPACSDETFGRGRD